MGTTLNKKAYMELIEDDIAWLKEHTPDGCVQSHIEGVLAQSVDHYYPETPTETRTDQPTALPWTTEAPTQEGWQPIETAPGEKRLLLGDRV